MKFFDRFFVPYAEYCLRTTFSEEELKEVIAKEIPFHSDLSATFRAMFSGRRITFFRIRKPLVLTPFQYNNSLQGAVFIECTRSEYSPETILHITIAPLKTTWKWFSRFMFCFYGLLGGLALYAGVWQMLIPLALMPGFLLMVLVWCRSMAEDEIPKIRQALELDLRNLEKKYRSDSPALGQ